MSFTDDVWEATAPIVEKIFIHPFITELAAGTLATERFHEYMTQDALYLVDYGRALASLAASARDAEETLFWARGTYSTIVEERQLHADHVNLLADAQRNPTCVAYCAFLRTLAGRGHEVAVAGVLPCYWVYTEVGHRLLDRTGDLASHPYGDWIATYADEDFAESTRRAKEYANIMASDASHVVRKAMSEAYEQATRYEWMFWDAAYRMETWPV